MTEVTVNVMMSAGSRMTSEPSACHWLVSDVIAGGDVRGGPQSESSREREAWLQSRVGGARGGGGEDLVLTFAAQEI